MSSLTLTVGQTTTVDLKLGLARLTEAVTVEARSRLLDTSSNAFGTTITKAQLDDLPLAGRDFAALARLAPRRDQSRELTAGGRLTRNNSVVVDGTSNDEQGVAGTRGSFCSRRCARYGGTTSACNHERRLVEAPGVAPGSENTCTQESTMRIRF